MLGGADWEAEKAQLQTLVEKNQQIAEDLETKLRQRELEFEEEMEEREKSTTTKTQYLESENRVLKEIQDKKITSEKDRIQFHKTLRNMLLEEIERIEKEQERKEEEMEQWRMNFESDMGKEQDRLNSAIEDLTHEKNSLERELSRTLNDFGHREQELNSRIEYLTLQKSNLEAKQKETQREMSQLATTLEAQKSSNNTDEVKWEVEREELFETVAKS